MGILLGDLPNWGPQAIAASAVVPLFVLSWLGSDWATRFQYVVMVVLTVGILSFIAGGVPLWRTDQLLSNVRPAADIPFWTLFAIFFPAVTGFTQGVSMSGDLADPRRSLPLGTFSAVGLSMAVYVGLAVLFAGILPGAVLAADYGAMRRVSLAAWAIDAGVIAATLSSALASFMGAPRILQSLARDRVFPILTPFEKGHGANENPRRGVLLAAAIALVTVAIGKLDLIAPIISMFFLISYGLLNYATYFEASTKSPSFRPSFRYFDRRLSLLGAVACLAAMLALDVKAGLAAVAVLFALYQYLARTVVIDRWADGNRSSRLQQVRGQLYALDADAAHARDWRPVLMVFSSDRARRHRLTRFASWLEGGAGFTTVVQLVEGRGAAARRQRVEFARELAADIRQQKIAAFPLAVSMWSFRSGVPVLLQSHGIGPVRVNTVVLNSFEGDDDDLLAMEKALRDAVREGCNLVVLQLSEDAMTAIESTPTDQRVIDVWFADGNSGQLMLLFAHLMTRHPDWEDARVRLLSSADEGREAETRQSLVNMLEEVRIDAEPVVVEAGQRALLAASRASSLALLPFRLSSGALVLSDGTDATPVLEALPGVALVHAAEDVDLTADPEEGPQAVLAEAMDEASRAEARAELAIANSARQEDTLTATRERLIAARDSAADEESIAALERELAAAEAKAEKLRRRAARASSKARDAVGALNDALGTGANSGDPADDAPDSSG